MLGSLNSVVLSPEPFPTMDGSDNVTSSQPMIPFATRSKEYEVEARGTDCHLFSIAPCDDVTVVSHRHWIGGELLQTNKSINFFSSWYEALAVIHKGTTELMTSALINKEIDPNDPQLLSLNAIFWRPFVEQITASLSINRSLILEQRMRGHRLSSRGARDSSKIKSALDEAIEAHEVLLMEGNGFSIKDVENFVYSLQLCSFFRRSVRMLEHDIRYNHIAFTTDVQLFRKILSTATPWTVDKTDVTTGTDETSKVTNFLEPFNRRCNRFFVRGCSVISVDDDKVSSASKQFKDYNLKVHSFSDESKGIVFNLAVDMVTGMILHVLPMEKNMTGLDALKRCIGVFSKSKSFETTKPDDRIKIVRDRGYSGSGVSSDELTFATQCFQRGISLLCTVKNGHGQFNPGSPFRTTNGNVKNKDKNPSFSSAVQKVCGDDEKDGVDDLRSSFLPSPQPPPATRNSPETTHVPVVVPHGKSLTADPSTLETQSMDVECETSIVAEPVDDTGVKPRRSRRKTKTTAVKELSDEQATVRKSKANVTWSEKRKTPNSTHSITYVSSAGAAMPQSKKVKSRNMEKKTGKDTVKDAAKKSGSIRTRHVKEVHLKNKMLIYNVDGLKDHQFVNFSKPLNVGVDQCGGLTITAQPRRVYTQTQDGQLLSSVVMKAHSYQDPINRSSTTGSDIVFSVHLMDRKSNSVTICVANWPGIDQGTLVATEGGESEELPKFAQRYVEEKQLCVWTRKQGVPAWFILRPGFVTSTFANELYDDKKNFRSNISSDDLMKKCAARAVLTTVSGM